MTSEGTPLEMRLTLQERIELAHWRRRDREIQQTLETGRLDILSGETAGREFAADEAS